MNRDSGILIIGCFGMLGRELTAECARRGVDARALDGPTELDVTDAAAVTETLRREAPRVVINATGYTDVDGAETQRELADQINSVGPHNLALACRELDCTLVHYSTDYVFNGRTDRPYRVDDEPDPINAYGRSKLDGEREIIASGCRHLIIRTSWLFAAHSRNFVRTILDLASRRPTLNVVNDQCGRTTYSPDLARMTLDLVERDEHGIYHAANDGQCTWFDLATAVAAQANSACVIHPCPTSAYPLPAPRPAFSVLDLSATTALIGPPRHWTEAVAECVGQLADQGVTQT